MTTPTLPRALAWIALAAMALTAAPARASEHAVDYATTETTDGYGVVFRDDLLAGDGAGLSAPLVRVRPHGARNALLRLRTSVLLELRKSVEAL